MRELKVGGAFHPTWRRQVLMRLPSANPHNPHSAADTGCHDLAQAPDRSD